MINSDLTWQKLKATLLYLPVLVVIILTSLTMRGNMQGMNQAIRTVYQDRLQPALDILYLSEHLHARRHLLEAYLGSPDQSSAVALKSQLRLHRSVGEQLIRQFEKSALVEEEVQTLEAFKTTLLRYAALERTIIERRQSASPQAALDLFHQKGATVFQKGVDQLHELGRIQSTVGQQVLQQSKAESNRFYSNSTLQIVVSILIALAILSLLHRVKRPENTAFYPD